MSRMYVECQVLLIFVYFVVKQAAVVRDDQSAPVICECCIKTRRFAIAERPRHALAMSIKKQLLKKRGLDIEVMNNYRPISDLTTVSKLLERLVLSRIRPHLTQSPSFSHLQSAYLRGRSTETALQQVLDSVFTAAISKRATILAYRRLSTLSATRLSCGV